MKDIFVLERGLNQSEKKNIFSPVDDDVDVLVYEKGFFLHFGSYVIRDNDKRSLNGA